MCIQWPVLFHPRVTILGGPTVYLSIVKVTYGVCSILIEWLAVVFGINSVSNAGKKIVIVQGAAEHYYNFHTCIVSTINSKYYSKPYCYRLIQYCCHR